MRVEAEAASFKEGGLRLWGAYRPRLSPATSVTRSNVVGRKKTPLEKRLDFFFIGKGCPGVKAAGPPPAALLGVRGTPGPGRRSNGGSYQAGTFHRRSNAFPL